MILQDQVFVEYLCVKCDKLMHAFSCQTYQFKQGEKTHISMKCQKCGKLVAEVVIEEPSGQPAKKRGRKGMAVGVGGPDEGVGDESAGDKS